MLDNYVRKVTFSINTLGHTRESHDFGLFTDVKKIILKIGLNLFPYLVTISASVTKKAVGVSRY